MPRYKFVANSCTLLTSLGRSVPGVSGQLAAVYMDHCQELEETSRDFATDNSYAKESEEAGSNSTLFVERDSEVRKLRLWRIIGALLHWTCSGPHHITGSRLLGATNGRLRTTNSIHISPLGNSCSAHSSSPASEFLK